MARVPFTYISFEEFMNIIVYQTETYILINLRIIVVVGLALMEIKE